MLEFKTSIVALCIRQAATTSFLTGVTGVRALRRVVLEISQDSENAKNLEILTTIAIA